MFIEPDLINKHIAIIMDGNRRWAKKNDKSVAYGHKHGAKNIIKLAKYCSETKIKYLTLFAFSTENWKRSKLEVLNLKNLFSEFIDKNIDEILDNNIKINVIGNINDFGLKISQKVLELVNKSADNDALVITLALSYGSRNEIITAVNNIMANTNKKKLSENDFVEYLQTKSLPDPDILIRTGGEYRLSNFLLWQLAYTELFFSETLWPDFDQNELDKILRDFTKRNRRFGSD